VGIDFVVEAELGSGNYGRVLRCAIDDGSQTIQRVAVKVPISDDPHVVAALREEAICFARIRHSGVPRLIALGLQRDHLFLATELIAGHTLDRWLKQTKPPLVEKVRVLRDLAGILGEIAGTFAIHHRDLKLQNVMVRETGEPVVLDFGVAKTALPEQKTPGPHQPGNVRNAAPEYNQAALDGREFDFGERQDVWSFGCMAMELLAGTHPFDRPGELMRTVANARSNPDLQKVEPASVQALLSEILVQNPDERPGFTKITEKLTEALAALEAAPAAGSPRGGDSPTQG
jgi:serine/threonine protein kinase